jgi:hypothetical protein
MEATLSSVKIFGFTVVKLYILSTTIAINSNNAIKSNIKKRYITNQKPTQLGNDIIT